MIGCSMPNRSVMRVLIEISLALTLFLQLHWFDAPCNPPRSRIAQGDHDLAKRLAQGRRRLGTANALLEGGCRLVPCAPSLFEFRRAGRRKRQSARAPVTTGADYNI